MDDQTRGLVHDDECLVLVDDVDRNRFGSESRRSRRDQFDFQLVVFTQLVGRFSRLAVDENVFRVD
jgi:hypothetical protein